MSNETARQTGSAKTARNPVKIIPVEPLKKPDWIRVKFPSSRTFYDVKQILREHSLHTVCEEASCPNIGECFGKGTATFMILGDLCTRRCHSAMSHTGAPNRRMRMKPKISRARSRR